MTEPRFLLDSNFCIHILNEANTAAVRRLEQCVVGSVVTSSIVYAEVMLGAAQRDGLQQAQRFFQLVPVLPFDDAAAEVYAQLPFRRQSFDRLIAAQALALELTVVTSNLKDFTDIPKLKVEDWTR